MLKGEDYGSRVIPTAQLEGDKIVLDFNDFVDHLIALMDMYKQGFLGRDDTPGYIISTYRMILGDDIVDAARDIASEEWHKKEG